jgi:LysM repeat protein
VVLVGFFLVLVAGLAVALAPSSRAADPPGPAPTAEVLPGDTLWSVAQRHRPARQPFRVIDEIRRLNGMDDYTIHAGQRLILPREE